jgi:hypothetical protein
MPDGLVKPSGTKKDDSFFQKATDEKWAWFKTGLHFLDSLHFSETGLTDKYQEVIYSTHP